MTGKTGTMVLAALMAVCLAGTAYAKAIDPPIVDNCNHGVCWITDDTDITIDITTDAPVAPAPMLKMGNGLPTRPELDVKGVTLQHYFNLPDAAKDRVRANADALARAQINAGANVDDWTTRLRWATKMEMGA